MSNNKFIERLKGENTTGAVLEIKNTATKTSFANMPTGTSNAINVYEDARGDATAVLSGAESWKLNNSTLVDAITLNGDGRDFSSTYTASGNTSWVDAVYTFGEAKIFTPATKWVLKLCGTGLLSEASHIIDFTLILNFNNQHTITKTFSVKEQAFEFCQEFVVDFSESEQTAIKMANTDTMTVQLICADSTASATIYNGMTTLTALQRRIDAETVVAGGHDLSEIEEDLYDLKDDFDQFVIDTNTALGKKVNIDGTSIMTGPLKMRAGSMQGAVAPYWDGIGLFKLNSNNSVTLMASMEAPDGFCPAQDNTYNLGKTSYRWKDANIARVITGVINNGYDIAVPATNSADTLALKSQVDDAANSGSQLYTTGVWYAKMYAATIIPASAEVEGRNYADFSQVDGDNNPIIVVYTYTSGAWALTETITPPATYNGYMTITSKIWDISEQTGQQGGLVLWSYNQKTFTPYPRIVSFDGANITNSTFQGSATLSGESTVTIPADPVSTQIVNKNYVDTACTGFAATSLNNLTTTGKANISALGTFDNNENYASGSVGAAIKSKATSGHEIIATQEPTAQNNYTWYRKYADGWVEQGGVRLGSVSIPGGGEGTFGDFNFPVVMANTDYTAIATGGTYVFCMNESRGTAAIRFIFGAYGTTTRTLHIVNWYVCGKAA